MSNPFCHQSLFSFRYLMAPVFITIPSGHSVVWHCPPLYKVLQALSPCSSIQIQQQVDEASLWNGLLSRRLDHHPPSRQVRQNSLSEPSYINCTIYKTCMHTFKNRQRQITTKTEIKWVDLCKLTYTFSIYLMFIIMLEFIKKYLGCVCRSSCS